MLLHSEFSYAPALKLADIITNVMSFANTSFKRPNLLSERNHFKNWFVPFSVQLSSAASMPAGSRTIATHTENCEDVIHVRAVIHSWFADYCIQRSWFKWQCEGDSRPQQVVSERGTSGCESRSRCHSLMIRIAEDLVTYCAESGDVSLTHSGQRSWFTFSNHTA